MTFFRSGPTRRIKTFFIITFNTRESTADRQFISNGSNHDVARSRPDFRRHIVVVDYIVHSTCMNSYVRDDAFYVPLSYYSPSTLEFSNRMFFAPVISYIISTSSFIFFWRKYSSFCLYDFQFFSFFGTISRAVLIKFCFIHIPTNLYVSSEYNVSVFIIFFFQ